VTKELHVTAPTDPEELAEREARGKRVAEMIQKQIMMAGLAPAQRVAGLVDVIDEAEELCYIDDNIPVEKPTICLPDSVLEGNKTKDKEVIEEAPEKGQGSGLKADDPIELESINIEHPNLKLPLSPRVSLDDAEKRNDGDDVKDVVMRSRNDDALSLENTGVLPLTCFLPSNTYVLSQLQTHHFRLLF
jgi:hypothetical protein